MKYFKTINSLSELKKQFRALVLINHPDRGGSTEAMQALNEEFEQLYKIWERKRPTAATTENTGYESDYEGETASEYSERVYNEYRWTGSRYDRNLRKDDLLKLFRTWLKETYPGCRFTMNQRGCNSINLHVMKMDFNPFCDGVMRKRYTPNRYRINEDAVLNDRARDIMSNISSYIQSYNYDDSEMMTDYHDTNFYFEIELGNDSTAFAVEIPRERRTGGLSDPEFKRPIGLAHQAIKTALGKAYFSHCEFRHGKSFAALGENHIYGEEVGFYPLTYSGRKTAQKRVERLQSVGILCDIVGCYIRFLGYAPETERALADEERAADAAEKEWNARKEAAVTDAPKESAVESESDPETETADTEVICTGKSDSQSFGTFEIISYSEKSFAIFGDTLSIKDKLTEVGGRFNSRLKYAEGKRPGWVFSLLKRTEVQRIIQSHTSATLSTSDNAAYVTSETSQVLHPEKSDVPEEKTRNTAPATICQALSENNLLNVDRLVQIQRSGYEALFIDYTARYFRDMPYGTFVLDGLIAGFPLEELTAGNICIYIHPNGGGRGVQFVTGSSLGVCLARIMQQYGLGATRVNSLSFPLSDQVYIIDVPLLTLLIDRGAITIDEYLNRTRQTA